MNILALDTCTECCSAALLYRGEVLARQEMTARGASDLILGMMDSLFEQAGTDLSTIDAIALGRGPGSFTGVRVGVGVAQGIAYARDLPVIPISSLAAVAESARQTVGADNIAVAMDARMGEVYAAHYQHSNTGWQQMTAEQVCKADAVTLPTSGDWFGVGTAWETYDTELRTHYGARLQGVAAAHFPLASAVIALAQIEAAAGRMLPAAEALPVYLRDNVAKKKGEQ